MAENEGKWGIVAKFSQQQWITRIALQAKQIGHAAHKFSV